jgi:hypothetical protein
VIKFISDLRHVSPVFSTNKTDRHELTEIELKVALSTINLTKTYNTPGLIFRPEILTSMNLYIRVIEEFGTHFTTDVVMGAKAIQEVKFKNSDLDRLSSQSY